MHRLPYTHRMWSHLGEDSIYEISVELSSLTDECIEQIKHPNMKMGDKTKVHIKQLNVFIYAKIFLQVAETR